MSNKLQLTLACGDYESIRALKEGTVKPDGIELTWFDRYDLGHPALAYDP